MYSGLRNTNSYGLRLLSETKFLIIHGFSYKIKSYIRVLKEIWILKSVDEGMRGTDTNFKESYSKYVFYSIKVYLCIMLTVVLIGLVRLTDNYLKWGIFEVDGFHMSSVFMLLIAVFIVFKSVRDYFFQHFVKIRKKHLVMAIGISIFLGIGLQISFSFVANFINAFNPKRYSISLVKTL